jgi:two-component sensor histidine kinase
MNDENHLYFSTEKGVQKIDLNAFLKIQLFDNLKLTGVRIDNQFLSKVSANLEIPEKSAQRIDIFFSTLNFLAKDKIRYRYRFEGEDWKDLGDDPKLSLVKLGSGNYNITIEAFDILNKNHRKQFTLNLRIVPPFYKTVWFYALIGLFVLSIILYVNRYLVHKEKQYGKLKNKIKENENQMLRSQMNPHFLFNSLNSINSFIIQNKKDEASNYLTSFSKLMRKILDNSRKDIITLKDELDATKLYLNLEAVRLEQKFDYSISIDKKIREDEIMIPALIFQPFLENSIWHGIHPKPDSGFIEISIDAENAGEHNSYLIIKIKDDGVGRNAAEKRNKESLHKSHGLEITLERLQMNDSKNTVEITDLYDENHTAAGTLVKIKIHYNNTEF